MYSSSSVKVGFRRAFRVLAVVYSYVLCFALNSARDWDLPDSKKFWVLRGLNGITLISIKTP